MSLKGFHILFILLAVIMSAGCAAWSFANNTALPFGIASIVMALLLVFYGIWFVRKSKGIIT